MKKLITPIILFFGICIQVNAQDKSSKEKLGDKFAFSYSYDKAIDAYTDAKGLTTDGKRKLAMSYHKMDMNRESDSVYNSYITTANGIIAEDYYNYAMVLKTNGKYEESTKWMDKFYEKKPNDLRAIDYAANKAEYNNWIKDNGIFKIEQLTLNTDAEDFGPSYYKDKIVFTSTRGGSKIFSKEDNWHRQPYLDMYVAEVKEGQLEAPKSFNSNVNGKMHDGPSTFSKDGTLMAFTRNNYHDKSKDRVVELQIHFSSFKDEKWSDPVPFSYNNPAYSVGHPCFTADGNTMYFASDMPSGFGGSDLYVTTKDVNGNWSKPVNLGDKINTEGDELFPFYEENSMMLFFSSDGKYGLGGLDIFLCEMRDNKVGKIINAGVPLNSPYDDFSAIANDKMTNGYFATNRVGGKGSDDLYSFTIAKIDKSKKIQGIVMQKSGAFIPNSFVKLFDEKEKAIDSMITNSKGEFTYKVTADRNYKLVGSKEGYLDGNSFATTVGTEPIVKADIILLKPSVAAQIKVNADLGEILELKPIYFDVNKYNIREDAKVELDKIVKTMNDYPAMVIKLSSYADCRASEKYNQVLSNKRAIASVKYIKSRISKPSRISGKGYGEVKLSASCACENDVITNCTEEEYQAERKTVFAIQKY